MLITLKSPTQAVFEEKRSEFTAYLYPITGKSDVKPLVEALRKQYPDARHHCWAYVVGNPEQATEAGFNDDGEPSGTAGKPMLNVLMMRKVGNVCAVVVRYFGGIKLGAGGLTRAYGAAVSQALEGAKLVTVYPSTTVTFELPFALEERVRALLAQMGASQIHSEYASAVLLTAQCEQRMVQEIVEKVVDATAGKAVYITASSI